MDFETSWKILKKLNRTELCPLCVWHEVKIFERVFRRVKNLQLRVSFNDYKSNNLFIFNFN
jgi:hypothetical protein